MSWFSSLAESAAKVTENAVKAANIDPEVFQKLTLNSPELAAERQKIDEEERRKEAVRDKLAGLLPWETRDPDRDILVPECKEVILKMSSEEETFLGPWQMPEKNVTLEEKPSSDSNEGIDVGSGEGEDSMGTSPPPAAQETPKPSTESLEKLSKLEPLPNLLGDFDLDSHVGLIQRLLEVDGNLVQMQSSLSGGGARESVFWKNYFFHCAYSRYEAGLSVDEVWSEEAVMKFDEEKRQLEEEKRANKKTATAKIQAAAASLLGGVSSVVRQGETPENSAQVDQGNVAAAAESHEHTITFGEDASENENLSAGADPSNSSETPHQPTSQSEEVATVDTTQNEETLVQEDQGRNESPSSYEMVAETPDEVPDDDDFGDMDHDDPELDALEAEIAEALGD
uniref:BSD domain-containing protein n=1 Tax=Entomoneis paludosa TaxID=265537 RepID=A0A7S2VAW2_9STRA|mmetsp:Transcript_1477/g.3167  ORF Transcript_1477/g.3167 Transcript_1477/m.3167 type:complete len:398 (+) Transcript_1477:120-1313(+)